MALVILLVAGGCTPMESSLYLQPGRQLAAPRGAAVQPLVQLGPFVEASSSDRGLIGGHFFRSERQILRVREGDTGEALRRMIGRRLAEQNIPYVHGDGAPAGYRPIQETSAAPLVVDGNISRLWLEVKSGVAHSNYKIDLEIASRLRIMPEEKVISRAVRVSEEMVKFSSSPEEMANFLDASLEEAARQIVLKIIEQVRAAQQGYAL